MWWVSIVCILFLSAASCNPVVKTTKGKIRGQTLKSRNGRDFNSFTGIPYAKPPLDDLRFMPPEPVDSWEGILDATKEASMCTQNNYYFTAFKDVIQGQEDCLYLNVYTPNVNEQFPVMFWIHGGGYVSGHGGYSLYGPDYLMDKDVVYVSLNYRLGLLGFLSTEDDVIPGNYGMKDQVLALRWVQDNIGRFGGDPRQVTIFGQSVGGASTGYHILSPLSKDLFHKAILHSGTPLCTFASVTPGLVRKRSEAVAIIAGCHTETSKDILNCLKKLPATYLVQLHNRLLEWIIHPSVVFPPVVESCDSTSEGFLCNHPITNFKEESIVPTLIGFTSGEGGLFVASLFNDTSLKYPEMNTDFNRVLPNILMYKHASLPEHLKEIGHSIMKKYFPSGKIEDHSHSNAVDMIGDGIFLTGAVNMAIKLSSPSHFYLFDYQNEFSFNKLFGECGKPLGVSHCDELISLFPFKSLIPQGLNGKDIEVSKLLVDIWVKFASSKEPTIDGTNNGPAWPTFTSVKESSILLIDSFEPKIVKNPFEEKYTFWNELPIFSRFDQLTTLKKTNTKTEL